MIYDCFTFYNELDLLEIRLEELKDVVDRFVLVEATKTFTNIPKPLFYAENKQRFHQFNDRIVHVVVDDLPEAPKDSWENQYLQRNAISRGLSGCGPEDIIIISDVDEIPRASAIADFKGEIAFLEQNLYYYRLNCLCNSAKWAIPVMLRYRNLTTPQEARMLWYAQGNSGDIPTITDAGWHFSYLGDAEDIQLKLNSFSQQDFNTPQVNNRESIENKIEKGEDLFGRPQFTWSFVEIDHTYPSAIYNKRFRYSKYIKGMALEDIFFDQYSRYKDCCDILAKASQPADTILDVGCGEQCLLGEFLPDRDITFIDPLIAHMKHPPVYKIPGDVFSPTLDGRRFDFVISIDTLEHVPPEARNEFLERLSALAQKGVIIAFPALDAGDAVNTDAWLNKVFKTAYGKDYCWLEEHIRYGLPSLETTLNLLQTLGWQTTVLQNGHTPWLRNLLSFTLCGLEQEQLKDNVLELSKYFNLNLQKSDHSAPVYRHIILASRGAAPGELLRRSEEENAAEVKAHWEHIEHNTAAIPFTRLMAASAQIDEIRTQLLDAHSSVAEGKLQLAELSQKLGAAAQDAAVRNNQLMEMFQALSTKERLLVEQLAQSSRCQELLLSQNQQLLQQQELIAGRNQELEQKVQMINGLSEKLAASESDRLARIQENEIKEQMILSLGEQLSACESERLAGIKENEIKEQAINGLSEQLSASESDRLARIQENERLESRALKLQEELEAKQAELQLLSERHVQLEERVEALKGDLTARDRHVQKLVKNVMTLHGSVNVLQNHAQEFSDYSERLRTIVEQEKYSLVSPLMRRVFNVFHGVVSQLPPPVQEALHETDQRLWSKYHQPMEIAPPRKPVQHATPEASIIDPICFQIMAAGSEAFDVIVFPVIDWHFRIQRPQHLAKHLAAVGHRVFYLTTVFTMEASDLGFEIVESPADNVFVIRLFCQQPHPNIYQDFLQPLQKESILRSLDRLRELFGIKQLVSVVDLPFWRPIVESLSNNFTVYDCMDYHPGFSNNTDEMLQQENLLLHHADLVITTSQRLSELVAQEVPNTIIRNGAEVAFFAQAPAELAYHSERRVVGYIGAISEWYDIDLVVAAAKAWPEWDFVLVGSTWGCDLKEAETLSNIIFLGEKPYHTLPGYLYAFDVCIIPFLLTELTLCTNPVKVYEYLSAGKPVVATAMPELKLIEEHVHIADDSGQFIEKLGTAMAESGDRELARARAQWAQQHDWRSRAQMLHEQITAQLKKSER